MAECTAASFVLTKVAPFNYVDMERKLSAIKMLTAMWIIQV